jgi:hypothetical protein
VTAKIDGLDPGSSTVRYPAVAPPAAPSLGLLFSTGAKSHGEGIFGGAASGGASDAGACCVSTWPKAHDQASVNAIHGIHMDLDHTAGLLVG